MPLSRFRRRMIDLALRLYPPMWRERYGEEVRDLVEARTVTFRTFVDLSRSAVRERMRSGVIWRVAAAAGLALVPFLFLFFLPVARSGRWPADPVLEFLLLLISPGPLLDMWLMPLVIAAMLSLTVRLVGGQWGRSRAAAAACGLACAVAAHMFLIARALPDGGGLEFRSATWWLEVHLPLLVLYAGFTAIGMIVHRLIAVPIRPTLEVPEA